MTEHAVHAGALGEPLLDDFVLSDVGNGELLIARHGHRLRYVHPWSRWLVWDGTRWKPDDIGEPNLLIKEALRWLAASANEIADSDRRKALLRHAIDSERANRIHGALAMAQSDVAVRPDDLDVDPMLLNVGNGTVDLRTGTIREHRQADLITCAIETTYDPSATAPTWETFLARVLDDDQALVRFLQRSVGYSLTGRTDEQIVLILHGNGANGKSTFLNTILTLLGDYAQQAPAETFLERNGGIPNDVARLRGARMVAAAELGEGKHLNEALIKRMTGGDKIAARFLRAEWFEFVPQFTPWLATNHRPEIRGSDLGIWRRVRLVPFTVTIPEHERDPNLGDRLRDELPGILAWAVRGCLEWQAEGLATPEAVLAATAEYRDDQDVVGRFLEECCELGDGHRVRPTDIATCFTYWANDAGVETLTANQLGRRLKERGYQQTRSRDARHWLGIGLRTTVGDR